MALPDFNSYKYIVFVDASGDDGYKFGKNRNDGSSLSFVVSCFVTDPKDLEYNKSILLEMKHTLFIKPEQEIKSTALKRHRNAEAAYEILSRLRGFAYSLIADKRLIKDAQPDNNKEFGELTIIAQHFLSGITHLFPLYNLSEIVQNQERILIVIDNMKKREMDSIRAFLYLEPPFLYDLSFRDSKDKDFSLIQIADIMAGTIRNYYENCLPVSAHNRFCGLCFMAAIKKKSNRIYAKCKDKKYHKQYLPYLKDKYFETVINLHRTHDGSQMTGDHFIILPVEQMVMFTYIECLILKRPIPVK